MIRIGNVAVPLWAEEVEAEDALKSAASTRLGVDVGQIVSLMMNLPPYGRTTAFSSSSR